MMETTVKKGVSKKSGNEYIAIEIQITPDYKKVVFLNGAEKELVKATYKI